MKRNLLVTVLILALIAAFASWALADEAQPQYGGTLRYAAYDIPGSLDPQHCLHRGLTTQYIAFEKLLQYNQKLEFEPVLAISWDIPDSLTYIFHLRKGVLFHDGSSFNAEVVKFNFERLQSDYSEYQADFSIVRNVEILDNYTVKILLEKPYAPFLDLLASSRGYIISEKAVKEHGDEWFQKHPVGTGPFKFQSWDIMGTLLFAKFENYWRKELPYLDAVEFIKIPDETTRVLALEAGEVDYAYKIPLVDLPRVKKIGGVISNGAQGNTIDYFLFNCSKPPFNDKRVREAFALAIDVDKLDSFIGNIEPEVGPLPFKNWGHNPEIKSVPYDPAKAKKLLAEAGFSKGLTVDLLIRTAHPRKSQAAEIAEQMLGQIGVTVNILTLESATAISREQSGDFEFGALHYGGGGRIDPDGNLRLFYPGAPFNYSGFTDPTLTTLLDLGIRITDRKARQQLYWEAEKIITEGFPMIWIGELLEYNGYNSYVHGVILEASGYILKTSEIWLSKP